MLEPEKETTEVTIQEYQKRLKNCTATIERKNRMIEKLKIKIAELEAKLNGSS